MSESPATCSFGAGSRRAPTKPAPASPEIPMPRMVSARPEATWFAASPSTISANTAASAAPARMPASAPRSELPVTIATAKPHDAPISIMPSTPRLSTPARSTTSSPAAAISSGVAAVMTVSSTASMSMVGHPAARADPAHAVEHERVAGEHEEQQHPLHHVGEIDRHAQLDLRRLAAEIGEREHQPRDQNARRVEQPEKSDDDRGEAVARRDRRQDLADRAGHLHDPGEPGERARQPEGDEHVLALVEPGEAPGARRDADHAHLEPAQGEPDEHRRQRHHRERHQHADMKPPAEELRHRRGGIEIDRLREIVAVRIAPRAAHEIVEAELRDIDEHQAG